jgi:enamine deaminase RidA (YjgF/YER057c/UK114 family)
MPIERSNVPGLAQPPGYTHLATVSEARLVFIAGQVPLNERGELVGRGDAIAQARQCLRNLAACLAAAGATPGDVVRTTVYVAAEERALLARVAGADRLGAVGGGADAGDAAGRSPSWLRGSARGDRVHGRPAAGPARATVWLRRG